MVQLLLIISFNALPMEKITLRADNIDSEQTLFNIEIS